MPNIRIGTSGWTYKGWRGSFYPADLPAKAWLSWYAQHFSTTEINGSFYRTPSLEAVRAWKKATPDEFVFAWKASKFITHWKRLIAIDASRRKPLGLLVFNLLAVLIGLAAGLGAVVFRGLIAGFHNLLFLGQLSASYDANLHTPPSPYNGSPPADRALQAFQASGLDLGEEVYGFSVDDDRREASSQAERAVAFLHLHPIKATAHAIGPADPLSESILDLVRQRNARLLVMGAYGHSALREYLLGSLTRAVFKDSPAPVFLCH